MELIFSLVDVALAAVTFFNYFLLLRQTVRLLCSDVKTLAQLNLISASFIPVVAATTVLESHLHGMEGVEGMVATFAACFESLCMVGSVLKV
jgi:hypothetical protein